MQEKKRSNVKHYIVLSLGSILGQLLNFFTVPLLTRMYKPEDFALWAVVISTTTLLGIGATFRLELTIPLEKDSEKSHFLFLMSIGSALIASLLSTPVLYLFLGPIFGANFESDILAIFWVIPILVFCSAVQQTAIYWYIKTEQMLSISILNLMTVIFIAVVQISLHSHISYGLIYGSLLGQIVATFLSVYLLKNYDLKHWHDLSLSKIKELLRVYKVYPTLVTPYAFLSAAKDRVTIIILTQFLPGNIIGFFSIAQRVMNLPVTISGYTFRPVIFHRAANFDPRLRLMVSRVQSLILFVFTIMTAVLYFFRGELFSFVFGSEWKIAGDFAFVLLPSVLAFSLFLWMDRLFDVYNKQKQILLFEIAVSGLYFIGLYALLHFEYSLFKSLYFMGSFLLLAYCVWDYYLMSKLGHRVLLSRARVLSLLLCISIGYLVFKEGL